jgi:hypothetical protein
VRLAEKELFDKCKEIFHSRFKIRKAGKESFNPIRDGWGTAFRGRQNNQDSKTFITNLNLIVIQSGEFTSYSNLFRANANTHNSG